MWLDWLIGPDASMLLGYTLTTGLAAWVLPRWGAFVVATWLSAATAALILLAPGGDVHPALVWLNAVFRAGSLSIVVFVVAALRANLERVEHAASTDPLTRLFSRQAVLDRVEAVVSRQGGDVVSVIVFDLDGLKQINDSNGHAAGDALLQRFADTIAAGIRNDDVFGRIGGDEFLLLCPRTDGPTAEKLVARLAGVVDAPPFSWGIASAVGPVSAVDLIAEADRSMYALKTRRRQEPS